MANNQVGGLDATGFTNKQETGNGGSTDNTTGIGTAADYASIANMRTALAAANGAYYTTARLDRLTANDMVYALRCIANGTSSTGSI